MDSKLHAAARLGNTEFLRKLGDEQLHLLHTTTPQKNAALHIAAKFGHIEFVEEMLKRCDFLMRETNNRGDTALHVASRVGHVRIVEVLINCRRSLSRSVSEFSWNDDVEEGQSDQLSSEHEIWRMENRENNTALHEAVRHGHCEVAKVLLKEDEDLPCFVNKAGESALYLAAEQGSLEIVKKILTTASAIVENGPEGRTPLHAAVICGHFEVVVELLKERSHLIRQVDTFKSTALHYASSGGHLNIVQILLETDASLTYLLDEEGLSPLHIAAGSGHPHIVHKLLEYCPDAGELLDKRERNALHVAIESEELDVVKQLVRRPEVEELINEIDNCRNTPLHIAVQKENYSIVKLLLGTERVNLRAMNRDGQTALDIIELKEEQAYEQVFIWKALVVAGAVHGRRQHSREKKHVPTASRSTMDKSYKAMANTLSVVAALIATVTFAAVFTMPGGNKNEGAGQGVAVFINEVAFKAFVISDTIAMCTSMIVALVLVWAVPGVPGMLVNAVGWALWLMWIALGGMVVSFVTAVYVVVSTRCMWLAIVVCIMGCSVPFLVTPIVIISARQAPHARRGFQHVQIQAPSTTMKLIRGNM
ncbi:hypothetical protein HHK36_002078 [Tetracentron sinense]|uniref:PGG domain-containing protein n=1 Tax=Tetracentron sinense TaxID=13715 RepID=A0A835DVC8_TETSI|nr:hypothetical protein HHK36_002078 [Tetracentron sinense]